MTDRLVQVDTLVLDPLPLEEITAGTPTAGLRPFTTLGDVEIGVWELTEGTVTDTEDDEVFVVVSGRGTVTFADGSVIDLVPGALVRLYAGEKTTWTVTETIRKVYIA